MSKILTGTVVSNKMIKTIVVDVSKKYQHPRFKKIVKIHKKFKVHVEEGTVQIGEVVRIQETRPISKDKHFVLIRNAGDQKAELHRVVEKSESLPAKKAVKAEDKEVKVEEAKAEIKIEKPAKVAVKKTVAKSVKKPVVKKSSKK
jgi:small subunit ribosomal protein S17